MEISLLCNAGLALFCDGETLLIDVLNKTVAPFCGLEESEWQKILHREKPYDHVVGLFFTHGHGDHCCKEKLLAYRQAWPSIPVFLPDDIDENGIVEMKNFLIEYRKVAHAPMPEEVPPHVIAKIRAAGKVIYIGADAALDVPPHAEFLGNEQVDAGFWNSMYLSRPENRSLLQKAAKKNYIYHMPKENPDAYGIWKKCHNNFRRFGEELGNVTVMDRYPYKIEL